MPDSHERFKNVTAGIQSLVIAIAVTIGGIWTAYTFRTLGTRERAQFDREKAQFDLDTEKAAQERQANYGLDITVGAKQEQPDRKDGYYISALVKITNKGVRNRFIDFRNSPLLVDEVGFDKNGNSMLYSGVEQKMFSDYLVLRTGTSVDYPFLVRVPNKGFYMVSFGVALTDEEMKIHVQSGGPNEKGVSWAGFSYVLVQ